MKSFCTASLVLLCCMATSVCFSQAEPVVVAGFDVDAGSTRTNEHAIDMIWSEEDAGGGMGSISFLIDPEQPDDDSPEGKVEIDLPEGVNIADYEYASFYYKCDTPAYDGSNIFMMPMLAGGAGGGGSHHGGSMFGDGEWHYQEFHVSEFGLWWGDWTWDNTSVIVIGFTETNDRGPCEIWIDHLVLSNNPGDGMILAQEGAPEVTQTIPAENAALSVLKNITITFNQVVEGVATDGSDLTVNGQSATSVTTSNDRTFTFTGFPQPGVGTVDIELQAGAIQSQNGDAFAGYSYSFQIYDPKSYDAPFATVAPTIDGVIDDGEYTGEWINDWKPSLGTQEPESDADWKAEWTATHDANYYYVAFRASDDVRETAADPWAQDNCEFFIDGPNSKEGTGTQFRANWDGTEWTTSATDTWEFTVGDTGDGWIIEARFEKSVMEIPADGTIGFNIQPSDNDDGTRGLYYFWEDSPANNNPWDHAASWGNVTLEAGTSSVSTWSLF